ncbi:unnamed protein product, partial [Heterosigma akashiwo]
NTISECFVRHLEGGDTSNNKNWGVKRALDSYLKQNPTAHELVPILTAESLKAG